MFVSMICEMTNDTRFVGAEDEKVLQNISISFLSPYRHFRIYLENATDFIYEIKRVVVYNKLNNVV